MVALLPLLATGGALVGGIQGYRRSGGNLGSALLGAGTGALTASGAGGLGRFAGSKLLDFSGIATSINCSDSNFAGPTLIVDDTFDNANSINSGSSIIELGQTFNDGIAPPDFNRHSGEVIYIDNRAPITRSSSQKEEVKIVVEF